VAVIAPHGGGIESETSRIAESIAGAKFSIYCFRGLKPAGNRALHITSHHFDDPECLGLVAEHDWVLAIHGCAESGERNFLGGLDKPFICDLASVLQVVGIAAETSGHSYLGRHPRDICNRGARGMGAQFEISLPFRQGKQVPLFIEAVRGVLARSNMRHNP